MSAAAAIAVWKSGAIAPARPLLAPFVLQHGEGLAQALATLERAVDSLVQRWARGEAGLPPVAIDPRVREAAVRDGLAGRRLLFTRFDVVCPAEEPEAFSLLEVQAGDPSAMGWTDLLCEAFGIPATLMPSHRKTMEARVAGRRIAFAVPKGSIVESDHRALAAHYRAHGWEAHAVDPRQLRFDGDALFADNQPVDAVFRDALDELFDAGREDGGRALLAAHATGKVVVANPFAAALADDKAWLELLSTQSGWDADTWRVLARHVPCTRVVREAQVEWRGDTVDLLRFVRANRERLVLKPAEGYGGNGVVVGPFATPDDWEVALARALAGERHVVQEYVALPRHRLHFLDAQGVEQTGVSNVVHSLWCHAGVPVGGFVRASTEPVVNVHRGGGLGPILFRPGF